MAAGMPITAPASPLFSWRAPNRYPLLQPLLDRHLSSPRQKTYCVGRLADCNLFKKIAAFFFFFFGIAELLLNKGHSSVFSIVAFGPNPRKICFNSRLLSYAESDFLSQPISAHHLAVHCDSHLGFGFEKHPFSFKLRRLRRIGLTVRCCSGKEAWSLFIYLFISYLNLCLFPLQSKV